MAVPNELTVSDLLRGLLAKEGIGGSSRSTNVRAAGTSPTGEPLIKINVRHNLPNAIGGMIVYSPELRYLFFVTTNKDGDIVPTGGLQAFARIVARLFNQERDEHRRKRKIVKSERFITLNEIMEEANKGKEPEVKEPEQKPADVSWLDGFFGGT